MDRRDVKGTLKDKRNVEGILKDKRGVEGTKRKCPAYFKWKAMCD
jgi:hypothetical protein